MLCVVAVEHRMAQIVRLTAQRVRQAKVQVIGDIIQLRLGHAEEAEDRDEFRTVGLLIQREADGAVAIVSQVEPGLGGLGKHVLTGTDAKRIERRVIAVDQSIGQELLGNLRVRVHALGDAP